MDYTKAQKELTRLSRMSRKKFTKNDIAVLNELKKSSLSKIKSWATDLLPNQTAKTPQIPRTFKRLGQGRSAIQFSINLEKGLI